MTADRLFSERKHAAGAWATTRHSNGSARDHYYLRLFSFKYRELYRFCTMLTPHAVVVDFGCGNGTYSQYCTKQSGANVIALDWSFTALKKIPRDGTIVPVCADLHHLPLKHGSVDALFTIDTLGHLLHQELGLDEIQRICRNGARLFLHSECADYRQRWPDRVMIDATGVDALAELDGHCAIRQSTEMAATYSRRFVVERFYSPAGTTGWLTGYPEKYCRPLSDAGLRIPAKIAKLMAVLKKRSLVATALRVLNMLINTAEMHLLPQGGGSCFAQAINRVVQTEDQLPGTLSFDIVIATWQRERTLQQEVDTLVCQCRNRDRIIIVWQGTRKPVVTGGERVLLVQHRIPSLPGARNTGVQAGENRVVIFFDDDCEIGEGVLSAYRTCYTTGNYGAVAGFIDDPIFKGVGATPSLFDVSKGEIRQQFNCPDSGPAITLMGANMSVSRAALEAVGGFDEQFIRNAVWEDVDMAFRLLNAGYELYFCTEAAVRHLRYPVGGCRAERGWRYLYYYFANTTYFICTYVDKKNTLQWLQYWAYHLEYFARRKRKDNVNRWLKYDPVKTGAGLLGAASGVVRFIFRGTRRSIPQQVVLSSAHHFGDNR